MKKILVVLAVLAGQTLASAVVPLDLATTPSACPTSSATTVPVPTTTPPTVEPTSPSPSPSASQTVADPEVALAAYTTPCTTVSPSQGTADDCQAYRYTGTSQSLCDRFPGDRDKVECSDVGYRVTLKDEDIDPWGLDGNTGTPGVGCESYPLRPRASASVTPPVTAEPSLPVTGPSMGLLIGLGLLALAAGLGVLLVIRRRKLNFRA